MNAQPKTLAEQWREYCEAQGHPVAETLHYRCPHCEESFDSNALTPECPYCGGDQLQGIYDEDPPEIESILEDAAERYAER